MTRLRIAVVGAGHLGRIHTRLLANFDNVELAGIVDPVAKQRDSIAEEFQVAPFEHHQELAGQVDAAVVAATTDQHYALARDFLLQGVHVLIEKPITAHVEQADELISLAHANNLVLQVGHVERFNPAWTAVASHVRRPRYIEAVRASGYTFRSTDIGVVLDLMIHDLDLALSIVRSRLIDVDATGATVLGPHEDMAHAHLRFANGCVVNLNASRTSFQAQRTIQVITDRSYVGVDFAAADAKVIRPEAELLRGRVNVHEFSSEEKDRLRETLFTDLLPLESVRVEPGNAIQDEQQDFIDCILTGRQPQVSGEQARYCLAVADQIHASIADKQRRARHASDPGTSLPFPTRFQRARKAG
ncbi:MAG: Gfo/Idh/MocA family protein [Pirellulaceae bacterium]